MKKFMLAAVAVLAMSMFASCGNSAKSDVNDSDSIEVVTDSLMVDSATVACDSLCSCVGE